MDGAAGSYFSQLWLSWSWFIFQTDNLDIKYETLLRIWLNVTECFSISIFLHQIVFSTMFFHCWFMGPWTLSKILVYGPGKQTSDSKLKGFRTLTSNKLVTKIDYFFSLWSILFYGMYSQMCHFNYNRFIWFFFLNDRWLFVECIVWFVSCFSTDVCF